MDKQDCLNFHLQGSGFQPSPRIPWKWVGMQQWTWGQSTALSEREKGREDYTSTPIASVTALQYIPRRWAKAIPSLRIINCEGQQASTATSSGRKQEWITIPLPYHPVENKQKPTNQKDNQPKRLSTMWQSWQKRPWATFMLMTGRSIFIKCIILRIYSAATLFWLHHAKRTFRKQIGAKNLPNVPPSRTADWPLEIWFIVQIRIDSFFYHGGGLLLEPSLFANTPSGCISWDHGVRSTSKWTNTEYNKI